MLSRMLNNNSDTPNARAAHHFRAQCDINLMTLSLQERYRSVKARIADYTDGERARLIAVSKRHAAKQVAELAAFGQADFGENYVQEGVDKIQALSQLQPQPIWHFIGSIQSNKCGDIAHHFNWVQTLSRLKEVRLLNAAAGKSNRHLNCLVQINIDADPNKSGVLPDDYLPIAEAIAQTEHLHLRGLMAITAQSDIERRRASFQAMRERFENLQQRFPTMQIDSLSMGMSEDMAEALQAGSTMIRVGTALFGPRDT